MWHLLSTSVDKLVTSANCRCSRGKPAISWCLVAWGIYGIAWRLPRIPLCWSIQREEMVRSMCWLRLSKEEGEEEDDDDGGDGNSSSSSIRHDRLSRCLFLPLPGPYATTYVREYYRDQGCLPDLHQQLIYPRSTLMRSLLSEEDFTILLQGADYGCSSSNADARTSSFRRSKGFIDADRNQSAQEMGYKVSGTRGSTRITTAYYQYYYDDDAYDGLLGFLLVAPHPSGVD